MRAFIGLACLLALSGCATTAAPNFYNGQYYLAGDKNCKRMTALSSTRIMCEDKNGQATGYRDAMTSEQLVAWQIYVANQQAQTLNAIRELGQSAENWGQQIRQQSQQYSAPQVLPVSPYGNSSAVTYTQVGNSLIGSNGVTYRRVGNSILGSDGTTCQIVGQSIVC